MTKNSNKVDYDRTIDREVIAGAVLNMSYGHLLQLGEQLVNVRQQRPETAEEFAKLLHTWASSQ